MDGTFVRSVVRQNRAVMALSVIGAFNDDVGNTAEARQFWLGAMDSDYASAGHFLEVIVYNTVLTVAQIVLLEAYLKQKWGLD